MKKILFVFLFLIPSFGFNQTLDQYVAVLSNLPDSVQVDSMIQFARGSAINIKPEIGIQQASWALDKAQAKGYKDLIPKARYYVARNLVEKGALDEAIKNYKLAMVEMKDTKVAFWRLYTVNALGNAYRQNGNYKEAIELQLNSIKEFENELDSAQIAQLYTEVGYSYDRMKSYETAIEYHRKALQYTSSKDLYNQNFIYSRIAIAHDDLKHFDSAHYYNTRALNYSISIGDSNGVANIASNIGNTYLKQEKWELALQFLERSTKLNVLYGDHGNIAISYLNLGHVQTKLKQYSKADQSITVGIRSSHLWNNKKFLSEGYFLKSELFAEMNQFDSALFYFKQYKVLEDSLYNLEKVNHIEQISAQFETEKKEQQIELQKASLSEKENKIRANQRTILALVVMSLLIVVIAIAAYKRYKARKNAEVQRQIIEEQERGLKAVFNAQEEERRRISKELHDSIGQQLSGLKMAIQAYDNQAKDERVEKDKTMVKLAKIASDAADEVRSISHQMMPRALMEVGLVEALDNMFSQSLVFNNIQYEFEQHNLEERFSEQTEVSLYRICQELVNNIIKHAKATQVNIQLFKNANKVILIMEDNGTGIKNKSSKGHGLLNIKSRLNTINGEVSFDPSPNSGTLVTIRIPL